MTRASSMPAAMLTVLLVGAAILAGAGCGGQGNGSPGVVLPPSQPQCRLTCGERGDLTVGTALPLPIRPLRSGVPDWTDWKTDPGQTGILSSLDRDEVWNPREPLTASDDEVFRVDIASDPATGRKQLLLLTRQDERGVWAPARTTLDAPQAEYPHGDFYRAVSVTVVNRELHVCGVQMDGDVRHGFNEFRSFSQPVRPGRVMDVACAGVASAGSPGRREDVRMVIRTDDGRLWHSFATEDDSGPGPFANWAAFEEIGAQIGLPDERFGDFDATALGGGLTVVALTRVGTEARRLVQATRFPSGTWSSARDLFHGAPTTVDLPSPGQRVVATTCQSGVEEGRFRLAVVMTRGRRMFFTVISPGAEDWDSSPLTEATKIRPWAEVRAASGPGPDPPWPENLAERPFDP